MNLPGYDHYKLSNGTSDKAVKEEEEFQEWFEKNQDELIGKYEEKHPEIMTLADKKKFEQWAYALWRQ